MTYLPFSLLQLDGVTRFGGLEVTANILFTHFVCSSHSQIHSVCFQVLQFFFNFFFFVYFYHPPSPNSLCLFPGSLKKNLILIFCLFLPSHLPQFTLFHPGSLNILFIYFFCLFVPSPTIHSLLFPCPSILSTKLLIVTNIYCCIKDWQFLRNLNSCIRSRSYGNVPRHYNVSLGCNQSWCFIQVHVFFPPFSEVDQVVICRNLVPLFGSTKVSPKVSPSMWILMVENAVTMSTETVGNSEQTYVITLWNIPLV